MYVVQVYIIEYERSVHYAEHTIRFKVTDDLRILIDLNLCMMDAIENSIIFIKVLYICCSETDFW